MLRMYSMKDNKCNLPGINAVIASDSVSFDRKLVRAASRRGDHVTPLAFVW